MLAVLMLIRAVLATRGLDSYPAAVFSTVTSQKGGSGFMSVVYVYSLQRIVLVSPVYLEKNLHIVLNVANVS